MAHYDNNKKGSESETQRHKEREVFLSFTVYFSFQSLSPFYTPSFLPQ
jgi:hypothetical protein